MILAGEERKYTFFKQTNGVDDESCQRKNTLGYITDGRFDVSYLDLRELDMMSFVHPYGTVVLEDCIETCNSTDLD
jgi:hypothetical protein